MGAPFLLSAWAVEALVVPVWTRCGRTRVRTCWPWVALWWGRAHEHVHELELGHVHVHVHVHIHAQCRPLRRVVHVHVRVACACTMCMCSAVPPAQARSLLGRCCVAKELMILPIVPIVGAFPFNWPGASWSSTAARAVLCARACMRALQGEDEAMHAR